MSVKVCTKCGLSKDAERDFSWSIKGIKKHSACNDCRTFERMEYYRRNKEKELKYKSERQINKRGEARYFVFAHLASHPCESCGESDPYVLTFHHVRGIKKMDVSQMVNQGYSLDAIQNEIDKTIVLCANCHLKEEKKKRGTIYPTL